MCVSDTESDAESLCLCVTLYCCGALYTACVDASRTVFWDRSLFYVLIKHDQNLSSCNGDRTLTEKSHENLAFRIPGNIQRNWDII